MYLEDYQQRIETRLYLFIVPDAESGLFSTSEILHLTSYPPKQMSVGDNYQLNCTIYENKNFTENLFQWLTPRQVSTVSKNTITFPIPSVNALLKLDKLQGKQKTRFIIEPGTYCTSYTSELTIENVTDADVGEYKCHFYGFSILRPIKVNLKLHSTLFSHNDCLDTFKNDINIRTNFFTFFILAKRYLNISESLSNQYKQMIGQEIKWKVNVAAYPLPTFKW